MPMPTRNKNGGLVCDDAVLVKTQREAIVQMIKRFGSDLVHGKAINRTSFVVKTGFYDTASQCERIVTHMLDVSPLKEAAALNGSDRIQKVVSYVFGCLLNSARAWTKPFNPMIGELFAQEYRVDGLQIRAQAEHVRNHPPTTLYDIEMSENGVQMCKVSGCAAYEADLGLNKVRITRTGLNVVEFAQGQPRSFAFTWPAGSVNGILTGQRWMTYVDRFVMGWREAAAKFTVQQMVGGQLNANLTIQFQKRQNALSRMLTSDDDLKQVDEVEAHGQVELAGSWLKLVVSGPNIVFDAAHDFKYQETGGEMSLLDCRQRKDIKMLKAGDDNSAYQEKLRLETRQRQERQMRS